MNSIEYRLQPDDQLCFIHIMKTAGTTFTSIIDAYFHLHEIAPRPFYLAEVCPEAKDCKTPEALADLLTRFRFIRGHFGFAEMQGLLKKPLYTTILRKPLKRTISFYEFMRRSESLPKREDGQLSYQILKQAASGSLLDFITNPDPTVQRSISNHQTRKLAAVPEAAEVSDAELIASAKANLDNFLFVGLTERFQDSVFLLSYIFGWYPTTEYQSHRVAKDKLSQEQLPSQVMDAFLQRNQLDLELYDYAEQLFAERFAQMQTELQVKYGDRLSSPTSEQPPQIQLLLEKHYEQRYQERGIAPIDHLDFEFTQPMFATGWQRRNGEHNGLKPNGPVFRWTGPGTVSTLDFSLSRETDLVIKLRVINAAAPDILASLALTVNHQIIPLQTLDAENSSTVLQGLIPKTVLESDRPLTRLTLTVNRTIPIQLLNQSKIDVRPVGLAINRVQLLPVDTQPSQAEYLYLLFPIDDPDWAETANFIQQHLQSYELLTAPNPFVERFPQQAYPYTKHFAEQAHLSWVVLHKGQLSEVEQPSLRWTIQTLMPVFANSVFVVFTKRQDVKPLLPVSPHLRPLWKGLWAFGDMHQAMWQQLNPVRWLLKS